MIRYMMGNIAVVKTMCVLGTIIIFLLLVLLFFPKISDVFLRFATYRVKNSAKKTTVKSFDERWQNHYTNWLTTENVEQIFAVEGQDLFCE